MIENKIKKNLALLSITSMAFSMATNAVHASEKIGTINTNILNVRSGPSTSSAILGALKKGEKVEIFSSKNGWYNIKFNNKMAWISAQYVSTKDLTDNTVSDNKKLVATAGLNVRAGASTKYKKIGYISKNQTVEKLGVCSTGWYKVKLSDGTVGYASNLYLKEVSSNSNNTSNNKDNLIATVTLNLRSGPSTSYNSIGVVYKNEKVSVLEYTKNNWCKVKLSNGKIGYCAGWYLKSQSQIDSATNKPSNSSEIAYTLNVKSYAYCTGTITATGTKPTFGRTIAVDPTVIPYGTRVYIKEFDKTFIAEDCGGGIKGNKIDIFMNTRQECLNWGVREITLYILK